MSKTEKLILRVSSDDKATYEAAAEAEHLDLSSWVRRALHNAAEIETQVRLDYRDYALGKFNRKPSETSGEIIEFIEHEMKKRR